MYVGKMFGNKNGAAAGVEMNCAGIKKKKKIELNLKIIMFHSSSPEK